MHRPRESRVYPKRVVAVADTHTFEAELGAVPAGDVFVHAGDLIRRGTLDELAGGAAWITRPPTVVDLDLATGEVTPIAVPPVRGPRS